MEGYSARPIHQRQAPGVDSPSRYRRRGQQPTRRRNEDRVAVSDSHRRTDRQAPQPRSNERGDLALGRRERGRQ